MKPTFCRIDCPPSHFLCCNRDCVPSRVCLSTTQHHPRGAGVPTACLNAAECVQLGPRVAVLRTALSVRVPPFLLRKGMPNEQVHRNWAQFALQATTFFPPAEHQPQPGTLPPPPPPMASFAHPRHQLTCHATRCFYVYTCENVLVCCAEARSPFAGVERTANSSPLHLTAVTIVPTGHELEQTSKSHCNQRAVPPSPRSSRP